jgi:hypothetical protein
MEAKRIEILQSRRTTKKQIDGIAAQDSARIRARRKIETNLPQYQQYNAAADAQQQGFGNIIQGAGMAGTSTTQE